MLEMEREGLFIVACFTLHCIALHCTVRCVVGVGILGGEGGVTLHHSGGEG